MYTYVIFIVDYLESLQIVFQYQIQIWMKTLLLAEKLYARLQKRTSLTIVVILTHIVIDPQKIIGGVGWGHMDTTLKKYVY